MKNLTLKQFRYFDALASCGHFGQAAAQCAVTQPALSMQIKEMEETLGAPLFERGAKLVRMTNFGEAFGQRIRAILDEVDQLENLAQTAQRRLVGRLRIGMIPTVAPYLLPRIIEALGARYDDLDIHVRETVTPKLIEELTAGQIDIAIVALPVSEPSLIEVPLLEERFVLVRPQHDKASPTPTIEQLRGMRLLLLEEGHCFRDQALSFCNIQSAVPRDGLDGSSLSTLVQLVSAGIGVTLIPEMAIPVETRGTAVSTSRFRHPEPKRTIGMIWRKSNPLTEQLGSMAEVIRSATA